MGLGHGHKRSAGHTIECDPPESPSPWSKAQGAESETVEESPQRLQTKPDQCASDDFPVTNYDEFSDRAPFATRLRVILVLSLASWLAIVSLLMLIRHL